MPPCTEERAKQATKEERPQKWRRPRKKRSPIYLPETSRKDQGGASCACEGKANTSWRTTASQNETSHTLPRCGALVSAADGHPRQNAEPDCPKGAPQRRPAEAPRTRSSKALPDRHPKAATLTVLRKRAMPRRAHSRASDFGLVPLTTPTLHSQHRLDFEKSDTHVFNINAPCRLRMVFGLLMQLARPTAHPIAPVATPTLARSHHTVAEDPAKDADAHASHTACKKRRFLGEHVVLHTMCKTTKPIETDTRVHGLAAGTFRHGACVATRRPPTAAVALPPCTAAARGRDLRRTTCPSRKARTAFRMTMRSKALAKPSSVRTELNSTGRCKRRLCSQRRAMT